MNNATRALLRYYYSQLLTRIHLDEFAIGQLRIAVSADRNCARAWRSLGFMLANGGKTDEGISSLLRALEIEGDDAVTRFNLGFIYHAQRRIPEAIAQFEQTTALSPKNDRAWYGLGICHQDQGEFEKSVAPLQEAAKLQYFNPHAGYHLALAWFKLGDRVKCEAEFERVRSFDPKMAAKMQHDFGTA